MEGSVGVRLKSDPRAEAAVRLKLSNSKVGSLRTERGEESQRKKKEGTKSVSKKKKEKKSRVVVSRERNKTKQNGKCRKVLWVGRGLGEGGGLDGDSCGAYGGGKGAGGTGK